MYVWERLHVHGQRISGRTRRRRKFTDSYPFIYKKKVFHRVNSGTFWQSGGKHPFGWWKIPQKKVDIYRGSSSRTGRSRICSCVHHGLAWSCKLDVCVGTVSHALRPTDPLVVVLFVSIRAPRARAPCMHACPAARGVPPTVLGG
jgi:hypothetical protein